MGKLNLVYWTVRENYGDCLSPFIVQSLSGLSIQQKDVAYLQRPWISIIRDFLLYGNLNLRLKHRFWPFQKNYVCVGSILGQGNKYSHYWGTGSLYGGGRIRGVFYAVRGNLSRERILRYKDEKYTKIVRNCPVGDPALLLPKILPAAKHKKHKLGIIPHYTEYDYFNREFGRKYFIINLATSDVVKITQEITSCDYILSSSLHGLIVPHAYKIPALWIEHSDLQPNSNGYKFKDYFSSVGLSYEPFRNIHDILSNSSCINLLFQKNMKNALPQVDLEELCNNLLESAPFPLKEEFKRR